MAEAAAKLPVKNDKGETTPAWGGWPALESMRREMDRLFDDFRFDFGWSPFRQSRFDLAPLWQREKSWGAVPAVDIAEKENAYEITAELPGMDEKDIEVKYASGLLTIKGEKQEEKEEKKKDYYLSERRYGSFQRSFSVPDGVDADKLEATFKSGVLKVTLPKSAEAQKKEKKIAVTAK